MTALPLRLACALALAAALAPAVPMAATAPPVTLSGLTGSAGVVFRGTCMSVEVGTANIAGARIAATTYTFEVREYLKGAGGSKVTFRQVGTPAGGPGDLGRAAGLPVYARGLEYVLFLLPESKARLTSPAGASRGALPVQGEDVIVPAGLNDVAATTPRGGKGETVDAGVIVSYRAVRDAVLGSLRRPLPSRP